jgi:hypothetical protein
MLLLSQVVDIALLPQIPKESKKNFSIHCEILIRF